MDQHNRELFAMKDKIAAQLRAESLLFRATEPVSVDAAPSPTPAPAAAEPQPESRSFRETLGSLPSFTCIPTPTPIPAPPPEAEPDAAAAGETIESAWDRFFQTIDFMSHEEVSKLSGALSMAESLRETGGPNEMISSLMRTVNRGIRSAREKQFNS